jgi:hypothetical protein
VKLTLVTASAVCYRNVLAGWVVGVIALVWSSLQTASVYAWLACAIALTWPPLMLLVMEHTPSQTIAQILRDVESR